MYKQIFRYIEDVLDKLDDAGSETDMLRRTLHAIIESCSEDYGIENARLYQEQGRGFVLIESLGGLGQRLEGKRVSRDYPIIRCLMRERLILITADTPGFDPEIEDQFATHDYAAMLVGTTPRYILSFGIRQMENALPEEVEDRQSHLRFILESIRTGVAVKLRQGGLEDQMRQAREIQMSLLPRVIPDFPGYDIAGVSIPADDVGGDLYDCQRITDEIIGLTVADASGHGLPAALQARDVATGLRMGVAQSMKISAVVSQLNSVINRSGLVSRFISVFYGELDETGGLVYVNGGHCPPLLLCADDKVFSLPSTGPVLGPLPDADYRRSYATIYPGEVLVLFSDGVIERGDGGDPEREFGNEGLVEAVRACQDRPAKEIVEQVMAAVRAFGDDAPWGDDATLLVVKRLAAEEFTPKTVLSRVTPYIDGVQRGE